MTRTLTSCTASSRILTTRISELDPSANARAPLSFEESARRPAGIRGAYLTLFAASIWLFYGLGLSGCATSGNFFEKSGPVLSTEPWQFPAGAYPTQRLYRIKYRGPEGDLGFKLTLYLEGEASYRMSASDLGRKLWSLTVDGQGGATWVDYLNKEVCRAPASEELRFVPLGDLPLIALPKLLLGRLPAEPAASLNQDEGRVAFLDLRGQLWNAGLTGGKLDWWSLIEAGEVIVWWRREEDGGVFADSDNKQEIRWREIVREKLEGPLAALQAPPSFRQIGCEDAAAR